MKVSKSLILLQLRQDFLLKGLQKLVIGSCNISAGYEWKKSVPSHIASDIYKTDDSIIYDFSKEQSDVFKLLLIILRFYILTYVLLKFQKIMFLQILILQMVILKIVFLKMVLKFISNKTCVICYQSTRNVDL